MFPGLKKRAVDETSALPATFAGSRRSRRVRSVTDSLDAPPPLRPAADSSATGTPGAPVVGMVGAGQLARMTSQAATGLGIGFRVLAAAPDESAAQVVAGTRVGDYRSLADLRAFAAACSVLTFAHEYVPGEPLG